MGGNITDDAGKRIKILDPAGMSEWPAKGDERIAALLLRIRRTMSVSSGWESLATIIVAVVVIVGYWLSRSLVVRLMPALGGFGYFVCIIVIAMLVQRVLWRSRLQSAAKAVAGLILDEGLCPTCGYNFAGMGIEHAEPRDLIACPECGGAWRRERIARTVPFAPDLPLRAPSAMVTKRERVSGWSATDARGTRVELVYPRLTRQLAHPFSPTHAEALVRARRTISSSGRIVRYTFAAVIAGAYLWALSRLGGFAEDAPAYIYLSVLAAAFFFPTLFANFAYSPKAVIRAMLKESLCPSCGADLSDTPPAARDGATSCPQCRAAWLRDA